jgi:NAD(P)-dependent dehydrogenase (short-subunit alcohol dehydrogenase family)
MSKLSGKVAIVTGGTSGNGDAIEMCLAREGASLVVADVNFEMTEETIKKIKAIGSEAAVAKTDISKWDDIEKMGTTVLERLGRIDILVNNAGIGKATGSLIIPNHALVEDLTEAPWDKVMSINLKSAFPCCKAMVKTMKNQKYDKIFDISSSDGKTFGRRSANLKSRGSFK